MIANFSYVNKSTIIHRLDARTKIILLLVVAFTAASLRDLRIMLLLLVLSGTYYALARLPWRSTRQAWRFIIFFIFIIVGFNTLIAGSDSGVLNDVVLLRLPLGIVITWSKIIASLAVMLRMLVSAFMALPITFTIRPTRYGVAFRGLGLSDRIAFAVDLAFRLVPTYAENFRSTIDAQRARGFELDRVRGGVVARVSRLAPLAVPVTMTAIISGEDITDALDMRGFGLRPRTWLHRRRLGVLDWIIIVLALVMFVGGIVWRVRSGGDLWVPLYPF